MKIEEFKIECIKLGIKLTDEQLSNLSEYKNLLQMWNKKFNLTTIISDDEIYLKHFFDSLCLVKCVNLNNQTLLDFGTGAGFPGMVLAIVFNNLNVTLLESNSKKISFLNEVKGKLKLSNVTIVNERVEVYGRKNKEIFDIVTCRAVSNLNIILELSSSLVKINGLFVPMKSNVSKELSDCKDNISKLSYDLIDTLEYELPKEMSKRTILVFKKIKKTEEKYPRNYNIIVKKYK
ncbi:MAG: 16S rRNA (guanine(527)-N(7))-methyltransferase RsmG [bacterium]|nr:16S rRNA (guanine(527)-N(7))-methyltransferase RsmG [bacterium]